jgi:flagellar protein FliO/FliZ
MNLVLLTNIQWSFGKLRAVKRRGLLFLALLFVAQLSYAQGAATTTPIGSGRHLVDVSLALMGIIGLIFAISWFVKRFSHGAFATNAHIKILSAMPLGTRERIVLIEAGGQQLLLGITSTNINTLHVFEAPIVVDSKVDTQSDFSRKLMAILQQKSPLTPMQDSNNKNNSAP